MAEIKKSDCAIPCCVPPYGKGKLAQGGSTLFLIFIIHIAQLYKEDCTILRICWAVGLWLSSVLSKQLKIISKSIQVFSFLLKETTKKS